jgi:hypothetical protein
VLPGVQTPAYRQLGAISQGMALFFTDSAYADAGTHTLCATHKSAILYPQQTNRNFGNAEFLLMRRFPKPRLLTEPQIV